MERDAYRSPLEVRRLGDDGALESGSEDPDRFSLVLVTNGGGRFVVGQSTFDLGPGALLLGSPGQRHVGARLSAADGWSATFLPAALDPLLSADRTRGVAAPLPGDPRFEAYSRPPVPARIPEVEPSDRPLWDCASVCCDRSFGRWSQDPAPSNFAGRI